jgi:hypothetical protein
VARKKTGRRRGRPRLAVAKRRFTTRHGRRHGFEPVDLGSDYLRVRKLRLTGRFDLPLDGAAILYAHEHLDREQYDTLALVGRQLVLLARGWGGDDGCSGLWVALTGALTPARPAPSVLDQRMGLAGYAWQRLAQACRQLDGSRNLVLALAEGRSPPIVRRVVERKLTIADSMTLEKLRQGLDRVGRGRTRRESAEVEPDTASPEGRNMVGGI